MLLAVIPLLSCGYTKGIHAYLTDTAPTLENNFTIALDSTSTIVEKYPSVTPTISGNSINYEKAVQVGNTGYVDEYIRVRLDFSESDIEKKTKFSWDGKNYYSVNDYKNHLPSGWTYNTTDGYYYYTKIVKADGWSDIAKSLTYDDNLGEFFYKANQSIIEKSCITPPLIRYVKTDFANPADMRSYNLNVSGESVPFYFGGNYSDAWTNYIKEKGLL